MNLSDQLNEGLLAEDWRRNSREVVFSDFDQIDSDTDEAHEDTFS
ncbi:hypothetical protein [Methylomonas methanica]|nr:hypothetical protein [Methylomonas methanica]